MSDTVLVALVGFAGTLIGSLSGMLAAAKLTAWRLQKLEEKVDKHNCLIERTYKLEARVDVLEKGGNQ
jgi:hypothetical protein